jgi:mevalonate kinase
VSSLRVTADIVPNQPASQGLRLVAADMERVFLADNPADDALAFAVRLFLDALAVPPPDVTIRLVSQIPIASGLGSGAAVTAALGRALAAAVCRPLPDSALNDLVYEVEKVYHGTPSGIDNTVIVYERPVYFVRGEPIAALSIGRPFHLLIADTGQRALTRTAVEDVRRLYDAAPGAVQQHFDAIATLVNEARRCIEQGDTATLGALMCANHTHLQQLTVSSPQLDGLVQAALTAGALGAKLSGGGRGGNMIALVSPTMSDAVEQALRDAGAAAVYRTVVGQQPH